MRINSLNKSTFKENLSSSNYKHDRAEYMRNKLDENSMRLGLNAVADICLITGAGVLASKNIDKNFKSLSKAEKFGFITLLSGIAIGIFEIIRRACIASKYKKEYDSIKQNPNG